MRSYLRIFHTVALLFLLPVMTACDSSDNGPMGPEITVDFDCIVFASGALECSGLQTGGTPPFVFFWEATAQTAISGRGVSTAVFNYARFCSSGPRPITVRMTIVDDDGDGTSRGPISKVYEVCEAIEKAAIYGGSAKPELIAADWGNHGPFLIP